MFLYLGIQSCFKSTQIKAIWHCYVAECELCNVTVLSQLLEKAMEMLFCLSSTARENQHHRISAFWKAVETYAPRKCWPSPSPRSARGLWHSPLQRGQGLGMASGLGTLQPGPGVVVAEEWGSHAQGRGLGLEAGFSVCSEKGRA